METRPLGKTGFDVSVLGYGAMELRGDARGPAIDDDGAGRILNAVLDGGVNLIDTSIDYGTSEGCIGRYVSDRRDEYFLASKCGCMLSPSATGSGPPFAHDFSADNIRAGLDQSLRRLRTDHLDLVQVHTSPSRAQLEKDDTIATLTSLRDAGKVRFIGMSGTLPNLPDHIGMDVFDVFQIPYSAVQREHEQLIFAATDAGAGTLIRGGVARGAPSTEKNWTVRTIGVAQGEDRARWESSGVDELLDGMSRHEFVLRFTLSHPALSSTIVGTANPDHLATNLEIAARGPLPVDVYEEAKTRLAA